MVHNIFIFFKKVLTNVNPCSSICVVSCESASQKQYAEVAELADAQASGACGSNTVRVQVPPSALFLSWSEKTLAYRSGGLFCYQAKGRVLQR